MKYERTKHGNTEPRPDESTEVSIKAHSQSAAGRVSKMWRDLQHRRHCRPKMAVPPMPSGIHGGKSTEQACGTESGILTTIQGQTGRCISPENGFSLARVEGKDVSRRTGDIKSKGPSKDETVERSAQRRSLYRLRRMDMQMLRRDRASFSHNRSPTEQWQQTQKRGCAWPFRRFLSVAEEGRISARLSGSVHELQRGEAPQRWCLPASGKV